VLVPGFELTRYEISPYSRKSLWENSMTATTRSRVLACVLLMVITSAAYSQAHNLLFTDFDDKGYVSANPRIRSGLSWSNVLWTSTALVDANWHPLTLLSHMTDCQLFGQKPAGHHVTSVVIHVANVLLLFWVLQLGTGLIWRSAFVAALFAVHPLNVESVAWISERKNVLSTLFFLLTIWAYIWYTRSPNSKRYVAVTVLFILGLMSKPMLVTLPFVLLLVDYWPLERLVPGWPRAKRSSSEEGQGEIASPPRNGEHTPRSTRYLLTEKLPWIVLSVLGCIVTLYAQKAGGSVVSTVKLPVWDRIINMFAS
jgi:hypothetical protein